MTYFWISCWLPTSVTRCLDNSFNNWPLSSIKSWPTSITNWPKKFNIWLNTKETDIKWQKTFTILSKVSKCYHKPGHTATQMHPRTFSSLPRTITFSATLGSECSMDCSHSEKWYFKYFLNNIISIRYCHGVREQS